jgi:histidinol phosphatase-like PHP family hydrolase
VTKPKQSLKNRDLAELLAVEAETKEFPAKRALRRAARLAHLWTEEAADLVRRDVPLTELAGVGPYIQRVMRGWIEDPPAMPTRPKIRDEFLTVTEARAILAGNPSWLRGIRGDLQMHTTWSDGSGSIKEMAEAGEERCYEYIAITDHSQGLKIAGGIDAQQLHEQAAEIDILNVSLVAEKKKIRVLRSIELNLNPAGQGDMEQRSLDALDLVLGCFHSSLRKKEDQTDRYVAALRNPQIQILGHPRGRIYNHRVGLTADWPRVFAVAAELDKAAEIDSYPDRQDLSLDLVRLAAKAECRISLGTDAHGPGQLRFMEFGAAAALLAKVKRDRILNFMGRDELLAWAARLRGEDQTSERHARIQSSLRAGI